MSTNITPAALEDGWPVAAPEQEGMDSTILNGIGPRFAQWPEACAHAVVVARHGTLIYEQYFSGEDWCWATPIGPVIFDATVKHDLKSITKSVTSLLVGIGMERGWITDINTPVFAYFSDHSDVRTPEKGRISLAHLLTMSAGLAWNESLLWNDPANNERQMDDAADPYRYALEQSVARPPGQVYNYCGAAPTLLQGVLQRTSGKPLDELAQEALLEPLNITDVEWSRFPNGDVRGYGGLRLRPRDLAKLGQLVLNRGTWQGKQIISAEWITESTSPQINGESIFFYGYLWWLGRFLVERREIRWIAGFGNGGQRVYVVPDMDLVVAVNAGAYGGPQVVGGIAMQEYVLPAIR
jgi:CubicO group peptidase (beta-lactamase class C family)